MSDLQRSFAKSKLAMLPPEPPMFDENDENDENDGISELIRRDSLEDDSSSASSTSSTGTIKPSPSQHLFARSKSLAQSRQGLTELPWTDFFDQELLLQQYTEDLLVMHHAYMTPPTRGKAPLFVTHHGAGSSGLSFAPLAVELLKVLPGAGILSLDARGHGKTVITPLERVEGTIENRDYADLTLGTLGHDLEFVVNAMRERMKWEALPDIILVGHSLGGAVVTDLAKNGGLGSKILGYAVLDVVEGSAIDALQSMETYLSTRPSGFPSVAAGIEWHTRSRTIRNTASARVSVPSLLQEDPLATSSSRKFKWHTDLAATKPFWEDWFIGLSKKFLEAKGGKLLLLAGTDRLDTSLTIGQMQGKFQMQIFPEAGHFIHEDQPAKTANVLADFYRRNDRGSLVLPPKVADMLKSKDGGAGVLMKNLSGQK